MVYDDFTKFIKKTVRSMSMSSSNDDFLDITKYPSFQILDDEKQSELNKGVKHLYNLGKQGRWIIEDSELHSEIIHFAEGSNAYIYKCMWRHTPVILKKVKENSLRNYLDSYREIEIMSSIRHPNLVQFMGISINRLRNELSIVLEYVDGANLHELIRNTKKYDDISFQDKLKIAQDICRGLLFLHECKPAIVYRDLKPGNIMIDTSNNTYSAKIIDFGLSRFIENQCSGGPYKLSGKTGTLRYMSPEVFLEKPYDLSVDIYSFGLILSYMLTGIEPFKGFTTKHMEKYFENEQLIFDTAHLKNQFLKNIVENCISRDGSKRPSALELYRDLSKKYSSSSKCVVS
jgi:serine/threonine protein kinase